MARLIWLMAISRAPVYHHRYQQAASGAGVVACWPIYRGPNCGRSPARHQMEPERGQVGSARGFRDGTADDFPLNSPIPGDPFNLPRSAVRH